MKTIFYSNRFIPLILLSLMPLLSWGQQKATLKVTVTDFDNQPLHGEQILFISQEDNSEIKGISNKEGLFSVELTGGQAYDIKIKSVGDADDYSSIEIPSIGPNEFYGENAMQIMIEQSTDFTLENVLFDTGKSTLKSSSYAELNELVNLLKLKPEINIEIAGHTDNVGSNDSNQTLSENRANTVMKYLSDHGIDSDRLQAKGYGSSYPVADNSTETGRKQNRRTEIHILN